MRGRGYRHGVRNAVMPLVCIACSTGRFFLEGSPRVTNGVALSHD